VSPLPWRHRLVINPQSTLGLPSIGLQLLQGSRTAEAILPHDVCSGTTVTLSVCVPICFP
jgi:hypothetical protein